MNVETDRSAVLDEAMLEALMVLMGTDTDRILAAAGLHAVTQDVGDMTVLVESLTHHGEVRLAESDLQTRGQWWWTRHRAELLRAYPDIFVRPRVGDPRSQLVTVATQLQAAFPDRGATERGLLAIFVVLRHTVESW